MLECFLNYPAVIEEHPFALDYQTITEAQNNDAALLCIEPCKQKSKIMMPPYYRALQANQINFWQIPY